MKVVSDTSPVCYLFVIGEIDLLPELFGRLSIPEGVAAELLHPKAPSNLRSWIARPPVWLEIAAVHRTASPGLEHLQAGEREAIQLAEDLDASLVILDDRRAREAALRLGLEVTGLLGILGRAADRKLIVLSDALERLRQTNFRIDPRFLKALLDQHAR
jgi:predicted nucleic acid-binding protein